MSAIETMRIEIVGRQSSHYTRVVRMLALELGIDAPLAPIFDLMSTDPATYAGNPALKLPALRVGGDTVWGSLNACRHLARQIDGGEALVFWPEDARTPLLMNAHEIVTHAMAAQVEVVFHEIVSKRPPDATSRKRRESLLGCLAWLDAHLDAIRGQLPGDRIALFDLMLFCLLEHLPFRNPVDLSGLPALTAFVADFGARASARATPYRFDAPPPEASGS
ncbi:glutathione S-transferase family protein [Lysobacter brunescens]|uniref:Glutathione S-transferase family protein n=1 Tax=Lysobacter brunescens TaxID=262323 RepID=A0ABW2YG55_9GAMM